MENSKINRVLGEILRKVEESVQARKRKGLFFKPFWDYTLIDAVSYLEERDFVVIAELKRASPSKGELVKNWNPIKLAETYEKNKAGAISVLTEEHFFWGSLEYLAAVREVVSLPLLRKDFIIDPVQVEEAKAFGADWVLLIGEVLEERRLKELLKVAKDLGLSCLVEVHEVETLKKVLECGANFIGINNRNLKTLEVNTNRAKELFKLIPKEIPVIAESGYSTPEEIRELKKLGFKGVLIGTSLVTSKDPGKKLKELVEA